MERRSGEGLPFCTRNLNLDCPIDCPLNSFNVDVVRIVARMTGRTFEEVKANLRSQEYLDRLLMNSENNMRLRDMGIDDQCDLSHLAEDPQFGWDE